MCSSLKVLAVIPVVLLMLAGQKVGEAVTLALEQSDEVVGAVIPLLEHQLRIVHLLLRGHHLCGRGEGRAQLRRAFPSGTAGGPLSCPDSRETQQAHAAISSEVSLVDAMAADGSG